MANSRNFRIRPDVAQMTALSFLAGTRQFILSPFDPADTDALLVLFHDPDVRRYLWDDVCVERHVVTEVIAISAADIASGHCGLYCVREHGAEAVVGFCGMRRFADDGSAAAAAVAERFNGASELLYGLLPTHWGQGIATRAAQTVLKHAANNCNAKLIIAATDVPNQASVEVMRRLGMQFEGERLFHNLATLFYSISADAIRAN